MTPGLGWRSPRARLPFDKALLARFRRPQPRLALGRALGGVATAAMDVSDGLLIDAERLAAASGVGLAIDLAAMPVSAAARARGGDEDAALLRLATAGDDYELLFTAPPAVDVPALVGATPVTRIGTVVAGQRFAADRAGGAAVAAVPAGLGALGRVCLRSARGVCHGRRITGCGR